MNSYNEQLLEEGKCIPEQAVTDAQNKLAAFTTLRNEINEDVAAIVEKVDSLKAKFQRNKQSSANPDGLLMQSEQAYLESIKFDRGQIAGLLA